jgi:hypothetical protein
MLSLINNALKEHGKHSITFAYLPAAYDALHVVIAEEEGLQGVFKRLRRNGHQLERDAANNSAKTTWL